LSLSIFVLDKSLLIYSVCYQFLHLYSLTLKSLAISSTSGQDKIFLRYPTVLYLKGIWFSYIITPSVLHNSVSLNCYNESLVSFNLNFLFDYRFYLGVYGPYPLWILCYALLLFLIVFDIWYSVLGVLFYDPMLK